MVSPKVKAVSPLVVVAQFQTCGLLPLAIVLDEDAAVSPDSAAEPPPHPVQVPVTVKLAIVGEVANTAFPLPVVATSDSIPPLVEPHAARCPEVLVAGPCTSGK